MSEIQKRTFIKGLDSDTADEYLEKGKDRFRLNVRVLSSENGNMGAIETMAGNTLVSVTLPSGTNTVIGSVEDGLQRKNYYFVHNSSNNHSLYEYNQDTKSIILVFQKSFFNFDLDHLITGINVVVLSDDAHLLYWTDNFNQPRKINIEKAIAHTQGDFVNGYIANIGREVINRIKKPPRCEPSYIWSQFAGDSLTDVELDVTGFNLPIIYNTAAPVVSFMEFTDTSGTGNLGGTAAFIVPSDGDYFATLNITALTDPTRIDSGGGFFNFVPLSGLLQFQLYQNVGTSPIPLSINTQVAISASELDTEIITVGPFALSEGDQLGWLTTVTKNPETTVTLSASSWVMVKQGTLTVSEPNYLLQKLWTFKYKFIYDDFEESAWSAISRYNFPSVESTDEIPDDMLAQSNKILLTLRTGSSIVTRIKIAAKEANETDFRQIAEIDKEFLGLLDNSSFIYTFLNSSASLPIEINENLKLFDRVPLLSQSQEYAGQRIMDGLITEGFDQVAIDIQLNIVYNPLETNSNTEHYPARSYLKSGGEYIFGIVYYNEANQSSVTQVRDGRFDATDDTGKFGTHLFLPFLTQSTYAPFLNPPDPNPNMENDHERRLVYTFPNDVEIDIFHKPPAYATHYQIVRTKNLNFDLVFQWVANEIFYDGPSQTATQVFVHMANIFNEDTAADAPESYIKENPSSTVSYVFEVGDRIRFIGNPGVDGGTQEVGDPFDYQESVIRGYDPVTFILTVGILAGAVGDDLRNMQNGVQFEIFRPILAIDSGTNEQDQIPTFEIGECHRLLESTTGLVHLGPLQSQALFEFNAISSSGGSATTSGLSFFLNEDGGPLPGSFNIGDEIKITIEGFGRFGGPIVAEQFKGLTGTVTALVGASVRVEVPTSITNGSYDLFGFISRAAKVITRGGDTFIRRQQMPYVPEGGGANIPSPLLYNVEANDVNNMYQSPAADEGRVNIIDPDAREVTRPSTIFFSEKFIPETFINGLSSVFDVNFETFNQNYGGIFKLYGEDAGLIVFQERKIGLVLVDRTIYTDLQNNANVGASENVLSPEVIYYAGEYGIGVHPESFAVYGKSKYGIDVLRGVSWRLSQDGLTPISEINEMHNFFTDKCKDILTSTGKVNIFGVYDVKFSEYITAFSPYTNGNNVSVAGETLAWNELINQYSTFYSYVPENMVGSGIDIITFKDGKLFTHNSNTLQSNFYDEQFFAEFWSTLNDNPSNVKVLENISQESNDIWAVYEIVTPNGQQSNLIEADFVTKENNQYAAVLRDENTPNITLPLIEGDKMRDRTFLAKFRYNQTGFNKLFAVNFFYIESPRSNK